MPSGVPSSTSSTTSSPKCPRCSASRTVLLASLSEISDMYYYGCPTCRHVWIEPKQKVEAVDTVEGVERAAGVDLVQRKRTA